MSDIEFVDELPDTGGLRRYTVWREVAEKLRATPGQWAIVGRRGPRYRGFGLAAQRLQTLGCDTAQRTVGDELRLYARWPKGTS